MPEKWARPIQCYCRNCGKLLFGYREGKGTVKLICPKCRTMSVSKLRSRRHETVDYYPPEGEEIISN